jgi:hypothetical protein
MPSNNAVQLQLQTNCRFCDSANLQIERRRSYSELVCLTCKRVNARRLNSVELEDPKPTTPEIKMTPAPSCDHQHCEQLDNVLKTLVGLQRELTIIVRVLVNGGSQC